VVDVNEDLLTQATRDALARPLGRRHWDGLAAVIAALVGLLALTVSGYTAYLQRQQVRAQVWPYLEPGMSGSKREVILFNKGVGPAIIHSVKILVDGKPQRNWSAVFSALGIDYDHHIPYSTINGVVISANDHIDQLLFPTAEDFNRYAHQIKRVELKLCYCSSLGECWTFDDAATLPGESHKPVAQCPARGDDEFLDNENAEPTLPASTQENSNQESKS
jgi:hypothetical protein